MKFWFLSLSVNGRPFGQHFNVAFLALLEFGFDDEGRLDSKVQRSVILKIDGDGMMSTSGEQFDFLSGLATGQREFDETSAGKISFVENKLAREGASGLGPFEACSFTWVDGAFSFDDSHALLTSSKRCVVRARSVF